ncbi:MAG: SDR family NAD(P)-dependent oxidoreductase [Bdellovibrionaceae bacterium]|nr:SDR family NAD(P)-dependent oxidoreductase [Pseudobdellovibrionaceae bacterium]
MQHDKFQHEIRPLAVVTGASSGIGYELAKVFAKNGFDLIVAAEDAGLAEAGQAFRSFGAEVQTVQVDLASPQGVEELANKIKSHAKHLDAIAINAGVGVSGEFVKTDLERELNLLRLNVVGLVHLTKRVLPDLVAQGHGRILFTSSIAGDMPGPYYAVYAASKAFVQSFSEAIREEVKESGVTITALQPGATDTNFFARADMLDTKAGASEKDSPEKVAQDGFEALMAGKDHVVAGSFMNKVQSVISKVLPETQGAKMQGKQTKPGSART